MEKPVNFDLAMDYLEIVRDYALVPAEEFYDCLNFILGSKIDFVGYYADKGNFPLLPKKYKETYRILEKLVLIGKERTVVQLESIIRGLIDSTKKFRSRT